MFSSVGNNVLLPCFHYRFAQNSSDIMEMLIKHSWETGVFPSCHILCPSGILSICVVSGFIETRQASPLAPTGSFELNVSGRRFVQSPSTSYLKVPPLSSRFLRALPQVDVWNKCYGCGKRSIWCVKVRKRHCWNILPPVTKALMMQQLCVSRYVTE